MADESPPTTEAGLAESLGIKRPVLTALRGRLLEEGTGFAIVPGKGVTYTPDGLEKIKEALASALPESLEKNEAPAGPLVSETPDAPAEPDPGVTLIVRRQSLNGGRSCLCHAEGSMERLWVSCDHRRKTVRLKPGMRLTGCRQQYPGNSTIFTYTGPLPSRA